MTLEVLSFGRSAAEARMTDTFACRYRGTETSQDETTGREIPAWPTRFTTLGRLVARSAAPGVRVVTVGGVDVAQAALELHMPVVSDDVPREGDVFECLTAADDAALVGRCYRVVGPSAKSQATARRMDVVGVAPPWL